MATIQDFRVRKGLIVSENASVAGNVAISQQLSVTNAVAFANTLAVTGTSTLTGNTTITGFANVGSTLQVAGVSTFGSANATFDTNVLSVDATNNRVGVNTSLGQTVAFVVTGAANVIGTFTATDIAYSNSITGPNIIAGTSNSSFDGGTLFVDAVNNRVGINNTTPDAALTITGTANVSSSFRVGGSITGILASSFANTLGVSGLLTASAGLAVTGTANVSSGLNVTGAGAFSNTLAVTGAATFTSTVLVNGVATVNNNCTVNGTLSATSLTLTNDLPITEGGTGSSTASGARTNLGLGSLSTLSSITSSQFTSAVSLTIYDSAGSALKTLYGTAS